MYCINTCLLRVHAHTYAHGLVFQPAVRYTWISYHNTWCNISTICQSANCVETLESESTQFIQIRVKKRLSPLPGFEPTTSVVPSWCSTNSAIQAWISLKVGSWTTFVEILIVLGTGPKKSIHKDFKDFMQFLWMTGKNRFSRQPSQRNVILF